jgi:oligopeptide transport system ATP-binding protein
VTKHFPVRSGGHAGRQVVHALDSVNLDVGVGETLGVVGESGCGKSTLGRVLVGLYEPTAGRVELDGVSVHGRDRASRAARRQLQMVFQDPSGSLDPRRTVGWSVAEPLRVRGGRRTSQTRVAEALARVGLPERAARQYPHELSGGQLQRAGIARAIIAGPRVVVCDEAVSSLDVSLQAQIINLLRDLQGELGTSYVFISHDLAVVHSLASAIAVMYLGQVVERASAASLAATPLHPYTVALRSAVPLPDPARERARQRIILEGPLPSPVSPPPGCRFHTRCPIAEEVCRREAPPLTEHRPGHLAACHFPGKLTAAVAR